MNKIIIIGGGISGLSCAFDLINKGFRVELYERNSELGGQSRSINYGRCSVEYAWRIWSTSYDNWFNICKSIPISKNKTIADNFVECCNESYNGANTINNFKRGAIENNVLNINKWKSKIEYYKLKMKLVNMVLMSDDRLKNNEISFIEYINPKEKATVDFCHELVGPILGLEANKATLYSVSKGYQTTYLETENPFNYKKKVYVTNGPYNEAIFKHWVIFLKKKGVLIKNNTEITQITYNKITNRIVNLKSNNNVIKGDNYIFCLDQNSIAKLISKNSNLKKIKTFRNLLKLPGLGNQSYLGFLLFFSETIAVKFDSGCASDQPWKPVIQRFNTVWEKKYIQKCNCAEIWQVSVLDLVKGHNGKILKDCSVEEAVSETLKQLKISNYTGNIQTVNGTQIWKKIIDITIWPYWKNNTNNKMFNTLNEYKFSINKNCLKNMPNFETEVPNLYFGSVIVKGDQPMISQEMACTNGRRIAQIICKKYNIKQTKIMNHKGTGHILLYPIRRIDKILYNIGVDVNQSVILLIILLIIVIIIVIIIKCCVLTR